MLTDQMRRAGWRECPSDEVRRAWEEKGGEWVVLTSSGLIRAEFEGYTFHLKAGTWRPVSAQTWDYDSRGWGAVMPTEPGLWWRDDGPEPCAVRQPSTGPLVWMWLWDATHPGHVVKADGHWIAPCVKPEVMP